MFIEDWLHHESSKASLQGEFNAEQIEREGSAYSARLALQMVQEDTTKVVLQQRSTLFAQESIWDPFVCSSTHESLLAAAQKAAPIAIHNSVLTFIHKTVQEYLCAAGLRQEMVRGPIQRTHSARRCCS